MANSKISALTSATTVAGTEVLPIVQSSATVKVSVANLTPGLDTIMAAKGGTGQTSYAVGDLLYANTTTTLAKLADVATGNALISGGIGVAPSYGKIGLTTHVSGTLPTANGGTNLTSFTANGLMYASSTSALTTGSALVFDGRSIGLNVTPSGWTTPFRAIESGDGASYQNCVAFQTNNNTVNLMGNCYYDGNYRFKYGAGSATASQFVVNSNSFVWNVASGGTAGSVATFTPAMTLDTSNNLLVGQTSANSFNLTTGFGFDVRNPYGLGVAVQSNPCAIFNRNTTTGTIVDIRYNATTVGSISYNGVLTAYNTSSDYRLKNITGPVTDAVDFIMALKPKQGTWKADGSKFVGFLAHEFQEVSPSSVIGVKDEVDENGKPVMQGMQASSSEVIANIVAFMQQQHAIIAQLQADVAMLKGA